MEKWKVQNRNSQRWARNSNGSDCKMGHNKESIVSEILENDTISSDEESSDEGW